MPTTKHSGIAPTKFCLNGHQPLDYNDFRANTVGVVDWPGWADFAKAGEPQRMHQGHCAECKSTISYPPPAGLQHPDDHVYPVEEAIEAELIASDRAITEDDVTPYLFWDETLQVYGFEDGTEQGICQHRSTTDALDLLGADKAPTLEQLHALGDDWGFRCVSFRDKRGRLHMLYTESYRQPACEDDRTHEPFCACGRVVSLCDGSRAGCRKPACFEPYRGLKHDVVAELDAIQQRALEMVVA